jgi:hypothetical protein
LANQSQPRNAVRQWLVRLSPITPPLIFVRHLKVASVLPSRSGGRVDVFQYGSCTLRGCRYFANTGSKAMSASRLISHARKLRIRSRARIVHRCGSSHVRVKMNVPPPRPRNVTRSINRQRSRRRRKRDTVARLHPTTVAIRSSVSRFSRFQYFCTSDHIACCFDVIQTVRPR